MEVCNSAAGGVKYLYKYVYKGPDRAMAATVEEGDVDEIALYQDFRSFGAQEGAWRTLDLEMYGRKPPVVRLPIHLPREQRLAALQTRSTLERLEKALVARSSRCRRLRLEVAMCSDGSSS